MEGEAKNIKDEPIVLKSTKTDRKTFIFRCIYIPIIVLLAAANIYLYWQNSKPIKLEGTLAVSSVNPTTTPSTTPASNNTVKMVSDPGVTWQDPVEVENLNLIKQNSDEFVTLEQLKYYKIATLANGGSIFLAKFPYGMGDTALMRFRQDSAGKYFLVLNSSTINTQTQAEGVIQNATVDTTTTYQAVSSPDLITNGDGSLSFAKGWTNDLFSTLEGPIQATQTAYGYVYKTVSVSSTANALSNRVFHLKHADGTYTSYNFKEPFLPDDNVPIVTFNNGTKNADQYTKGLTVTCGNRSGGAIVTDAASITTQIQETGTTSNGDKIYGFKNTSSPIVAAGYEYYKTGRDSTISIDEFLAQKPIFVWKDPLGDYNVYQNTNYSALAECGKPVVYLYPTKNTTVTVEVGADITKSEPLYSNGWTALAKPDGKLIVDGKAFPYLFWEGQGDGEYPIIDSGFVVKQSDVETTLKDHLARLGLNAKESADFLEFWLPKMPDFPYVRLTWFGTREMNRLAPLSINPKPDTMIRIFLDFQGAEKPIDLKPQVLSAPKRNGFTVVEWGGLLIK